MFKKLCDFKGEEEAWNAIAELIEPLSDIASDTKVGAYLTGEGNKGDAAKYIATEHRIAATKILAVLAGQDYEAFKKTITPAVILIGVVTILNDKELIDLFRSQGSMTDES